MKLVKKLAAVGAIVLMTGCATGLNSVQQREYAAFENDGVLIVEKSPTTALALGLLPGFGSFYVREPGLGVINLLLWPLSILWDPISGQDGAKAINYDMTRHHLKKEKAKEFTALDEELLLEKIDNDAYVSAKRKIDAKYDYQ